MENWQKDPAADKPRTTEVTSPINDLQADSQVAERPADERPNVAPPTKRSFMTVRQLVITGLLGGIAARAARFDRVPRVPRHAGSAGR